MRFLALTLLGGATAASLACAGATGSAAGAARAHPVVAEEGTLAKIYYWRARPGKLEEYSRYIRDMAEPIDMGAQRAGAFVSVTTLVSSDPASPWTHMRLFILRDSAQLAGLSAALDASGMRVEPDSVKRRMRAEYSATLRDRVGDATMQVLH
jgi:hypothetical protein